MAVKEQGKLPTQGPMKVIVKSLGGKGSKLHVDAEETVYSIKAKASKKLGCHFSLIHIYHSICVVLINKCLVSLMILRFKTSEFVKKDNILICSFVLVDFKPAESVKLFYLGKELEDHKSLADQNVRPNSLIHLIRAKIHFLPRAQSFLGRINLYALPVHLRRNQIFL